MKFTIITPCYQAAPYIDRCVQSVLQQREGGVEVEYLVLDGGSRDGTLEKLAVYGTAIDQVVTEPDEGPADAINRGIVQAGGEVIAWLNADDMYEAGALIRVQEALVANPAASFCFGHCPIVNEGNEEIRKGITRFKEWFFPFSSRFVFQCINYLSQPACFFRQEAVGAAGPLRTDLSAAWDYEFLLRIWRQGRGVHLKNPPLARFRWHEGSISGKLFRQQFDEEFQAARADAGTFSVQSLVHWGVKWGIIGAYSLMAQRRSCK